MPPNWLWGYGIPIGLLLLIWGGLPPHKARRVTPLAALAVALAVVGYWAVGFAFHLGGAHALYPAEASLRGLDRLLAPSGPGWGLVGLAGFFLTGETVTPTVLGLFLAYLPLLATATLLVLLALADARRWVMVTAGALTGTIVWPIAACWAWGSGWLARLGETLALGHGFIDFGGSALLLWLPAAMALGVLLWLPRREVETPITPPPAYFPLLANLGVLIAGVSWMGWTLSSPFHVAAAAWDWNRAAVSALLGMAGSTLTSQLYAWLTTGEPGALLAARGVAAGWAIALAGAPFLPPWAALVIGLLAGLLFPLAQYALEVQARLADAAATIALGGVGGLGGALSVAFFADGQWGHGWNGGSAEGVTGLIFGGDAGQLGAQLFGLAALGLWGLLWGSLLGVLARPRRERIPEPPTAEAVAEEEGAADTPIAATPKPGVPEPAASVFELPGALTSIDLDAPVPALNEVAA